MVTSPLFSQVNTCHQLHAGFQISQSVEAQTMTSCRVTESLLLKRVNLDGCAGWEPARAYEKTASRKVRVESPKFLWRGS